jgi:hypothetical protein
MTRKETQLGELIYQWGLSRGIAIPAVNVQKPFRSPPQLEGGFGRPLRLAWAGRSKPKGEGKQ